MSWQDLLPLLNLLLLPAMHLIVKVNSTLTRLETEIEHQQAMQAQHAARMDKLENRFNAQRCSL